MRPRAAAETGAGQLVAEAPGVRLPARARGLASLAGPALVLAAALAWPLLRGVDHRFVSFSDGVYTYLGSAVAERGAHDLYGSLMLSQPPGVVLGAAVLWRLSPHVETIRLTLAVLGGLTAVLTYALGRSIGLRCGAAAAAAIVALTAPVHAQFSALDGEAVLAPLALALALALGRRRTGVAGLLIGLGFLFKLTWTPFAILGAGVLARRAGWRAATRAGLTALVTAAALLGGAIAAFGWQPSDLVDQIVLGQSHSGLQPGLALGVAAAASVLWWPLLVLAPAGLPALGHSTRFLLAGGVLAGGFTLKQGTFFNVLDPLEPFLALAFVAGAGALWRRRTGLARATVAACTVGLVVHVASVTDARLRDALPFPVGAALVETDNQALVDRAAGTIEASSRPGEPVLVNPLLALVAGRHEVGDQADWFILHAIARGCRPAGRSCRIWSRMKRAARTGRVPVVSVDENVVSFDPSFRTDTGADAMRLVLRADAPPIDARIYVRR